MRTFHLSPYYFLLQVFDKTGEAMFKDDWSGHEVMAGPPQHDLRPILEKRDRIEARLEELEIRRREVLNEDSTEFSPAERDRRGKELTSTCAEQRNLRRELLDLPDLTNRTNESAERFERRCAVEEELRTAFKEGDLLFILGNGVVVEWNRWAEGDGFHVDYYLSTVSAPEHFGTMGTGPGFVPIEAFDTWVKRYGYTSGEPGVLPPRVKLEKWLREEFQSDPGELIPRDQFFVLAQRELPDVSLRMFRSVWQQVAPESRKKGGRKRIES